MKKGVITKITLFTAVIVCLIGITVNKKVASAADMYYSIPLQKVEKIDNFPYPTTTLINISGNLDKGHSEFNIDSHGQVKAVLHCDINQRGTGNVWISRDPNGFNVVGAVSGFSGSETEISWFLESGTYYFNCTWNNSPAPIGVALLYEASDSQEDFQISGFNQSTLVTLGATVKGFLSDELPNDYYSFVLPKKANVTIEYSFNTSDNAGTSQGYCTLYNKDTIALEDAAYDKTIKGEQKLVYLLDAGTYYIKLNGLSGNTTLSVNVMYYDITLTPAIQKGWTKKPMKVDIDTSIDYSEILVVNKDVKESAVNDRDVWTNDSKLSIKVDGETFEAAKSGIYSVRITDKYGNNTMKKINITAVDVTKPKVTGITNNKAYKKPVTLKWADTQSGIDTNKTTLNGKKVQSGIKVTAQGKYTLKVYDKIGNVRTVVFYVDSTAPTAGVENGKTYHDIVNLKFRDDVSGIKEIMVDGVEEDASVTTMSFYFDGTYEVKLWDNAGNYRKIVFTIKNTY